MRILIAANTEFLEREVVAGSEGVIVDMPTNIHTGEKGYTVEFAFPNGPLAGGYEYDIAVFAADQIERV